MSRRTQTARTPFIGLTGGVGAGKSTALKAFAELGAGTLSADEVVHALYEEPEVLALVTGRFGFEIAPAGRLDRAALASRVFASDVDREWIESMLWPKVVERVRLWRAGFANRDDPPRALVVEVPLLFEAGLETMFDYTVAVLTGEQVAATRRAERGQVADGVRVDRQFSPAEKAARCDFVIRNDGSLEQLRGEVAALLDDIAP